MKEESRKTIVIIAMGEMGAAIAKRLASRGARVRKSLRGRGSESFLRTREACVEAFEDDAALLEGADFVLSVVPPAAARELAERLAPALGALARKPLYADWNAVSPARAVEVESILASTGCGFADGGILGFPPVAQDPGPRIYVSGPRARELVALRDLGLDVRFLDERIGSASALKCAYAALGKGLTALGALTILSARYHGVEQAYLEELRTHQPNLLAWLGRMIPDMYPKAYRWVAEMQEIGSSLEASPGGAHTFGGISEFFEWIAGASRSEPGPEADIAALKAFLQQAGS